MIQMGTRLAVADNTGGKEVACILPKGGDVGKIASVGDIITCSVKSLKEAEHKCQVKKGDVVLCVIVRTKKEVRRKDGTYIRFDQNAAVIINKDGEPLGTRVFGPVARELRERKFTKIISLAPEVL